MPFYQTPDEFSIHYTLNPSPTAEDVLLIHGNLACELWWHPLIESFTQKKQSQGRLICLDWRGYGKSKGLKQESDIDFDLYAHDVLGLIDHLQLKNIQVVGHSTGGLIATLAILKNPQPFQSLCLLDSVTPWGLTPELPLEQVLAHFEKMSQDKDYCTQVLAATIEGVDIASPYFLSLRDAAWSSDPVCWQGVIKKLCHFDDRSEEIKTNWKLPTQILHGSKDLVLPLQGSKDMLSVYPSSQWQVLEDQGHSCNVENPDRLTKILLSFWADTNKKRPLSSAPTQSL